MAKFKNGELELSIIQSEVQYGDESESMMRLMDNWGVTEELRKEFSIPKLKEKYYDIEWNIIYKFFGLEWDSKERKEEKYLHIEIKYE